MTDRVVCIDANLRNKSVIYLFTCTSIEQFYILKKTCNNGLIVIIWSHITKMSWV